MHPNPRPDPPAHRFLHEPLPVPGEEQRTLAWNAGLEPGMPEQHDQIRARRCASQVREGGGAEPTPALPGPRLREDEHHA
jgi:hypothetical protein